jgi:microcystin degradation protein MlrC
LALFHDPTLVREAIAHGVGATFEAVFNRDSDDPEAGRLAVIARVERILDGECVGRRGIYAGRRMALGPTVRLDIDGITVVVNTVRTQCADPVFFEMVGLNLAETRVVAVKSRGHFRSGFDEFFGPDQVIEVDGPGLCSPVLSRFGFTRLPRPIYPLDPDAQWTPVAAVMPARHG